jgi:hypothetical protein
MIKKLLSTGERNRLRLEMLSLPKYSKRFKEIDEILNKDEEYSRVLDLRDEWGDGDF